MEKNSFKDSINLSFNLKFTDLYDSRGLAEVDRLFLSFLQQNDVELYQQYIAVQEQIRAAQLDGAEHSSLILKLSPYLESFLAELFNIADEVEDLKDHHAQLAPIFAVRKNFIQRKVAKIKSMPEGAEGDIKQQEEELRKHGFKGDFTDDLALAEFINMALNNNDEVLINTLTNYCYQRLQDNNARQSSTSVLFHLPKKLDFENLINIPNIDGARRYDVEDTILHQRQGFKYQDEDINLNQALSNTDNCIFCHERQKDSCSHGMLNKSAQEQNKEGISKFEVNPLGVELKGCPLEEKISEMNLLKNNGLALAALATAMIDNPLLAATGHRICNECMRSCIYQKQEPVNIPLIETTVLQDVLELPYGFEIYSLLSRWNPLNLERPRPAPDQGYKVLVVGLGPAGFTLAHYLLNAGVSVVAVDGLKIEPLPAEISGIAQDGSRQQFQPIRDIQILFEDLAERTPYGFGGVAEYGITVRWNKNYLKVIRLLLERRHNFRMYGSVRFGSNLSLEDAKNLGFDHIALCAGAGSPNLPLIPNVMARGVRTASDFLMNLQLSGVYRPQSLANLQIRMPIAVIGGGLTAVDTATEAQAYYMVQVEKFLQDYENMGEGMLSNLDAEERGIAEEFLHHAKILRQSKNKIATLRELGGVRILYRKSMEDSTAYRMNYEELQKALAEGIIFEENRTPIALDLDEHGHVRSVRCQDLKGTHSGAEEVRARSVFIATGTKPNTVLAREVAGFNLAGKYFKKSSTVIWRSAKGQETSFVLDHDGYPNFLSFYGDLHPDYFGNVVKAMASAKDGYRSLLNLLSTNLKIKDSKQTKSSALFAELDDKLLARVEEVNILADKIVEVVLYAPLAARNFRPGQFYRFQNYEANAANLKHGSHGYSSAMEGLALTGAEADPKSGKLSLIALEMGGSSNLCKRLKVGEYVSLMGPTGEATALPHKQKVILVGGGLGNAVLLSIGKQLKAQECEVLYFAGYRTLASVFKREEIEAAASQVVWCCDEGVIASQRSQDLSFQGNIVEAMRAFNDGKLGEKSFDFQDADRLIVIGSDAMMAAVAYARHNQFRDEFKDTHVAIGSINSPMQCMMKEICAQCLQRHVDPKTGEESYVYSCFNQDQALDEVDFKHLSQRLRQNSVQEKVCRYKIDLCEKEIV